MADRLLRHKPSGTLYIWQEVFAMRDDFEEIIDVESRVVPDEPVEAPKPRATRKKAEPAPVDESRIQEDASRGLP
jgi:hypothetical protein